MMQDVSKYLQCTFSYVGYDKTAKECEEMLRSGDIDIYIAARKNGGKRNGICFFQASGDYSDHMHEREGGQHDVVAGDYSTYKWLRASVFAVHTHNDSFAEFAKEKALTVIIYYETPTELTDALINDEVDALVNSYIRILEDESVIENFGQTPYYIMARREDQDLIDQIDNAIDCMNRETPNWRAELYNNYYITVPRIRIRSSQMRRRSFLQSFRSPVTWMSGWMWTAATIRKEPLRTKPQILI